jgi:hypothetical protein
MGSGTKISPKRISQVIMEGEEAPIENNYDFERMIQEAMEKYGEAPDVSAPTKKEVAESSNTENTKKKAMDPKKQALLEKRKKYDPRAAIKNSKKATVVETTSTIE